VKRALLSARVFRFPKSFYISDHAPTPRATPARRDLDAGASRRGMTVSPRAIAPQVYEK